MKILVIGFSVTRYGNPSYPQLVSDYLSEKHVTHQLNFVAMGGIGLDALPFLLNLILGKYDYDLLVYEVSTSVFSNHETSVPAASLRLRDLLLRSRIQSNRVAFLHLPRRDTNTNNSIVFAAECLGKIYNCQSINLNFLGDSDGYFVDDVHPSPDGIDSIARLLLESIINIDEANPVSSQTDNIAFLPDNYLSPFYYVNAALESAQPVINFTHTGLSISLVELHHESGPLYLSLNKGFLVGILYQMGPSTSRITISVDPGDLNLTFNAWDEFCYYYRLAFRSIDQIPINSGTMLITRSVNSRPAIELLKESEIITNSMSNRIGGVCMLSESKNTLITNESAFLAANGLTCE